MKIVNHFVFLLSTVQNIFSQTLIINESMSKNFNALYDEDNDTPDWIEIYNKADTSINVENYSLSDDVSELDKWKFPSGTISPDSNIVVWPEASAWYSGNAFSTDKRIIGGFFRREESKTFTAVIDASNGEGYNKHNLVPFGEFQPFGDLLIGINSFFNIPNSRISRGAFVQDKLNWSGLVCWELVFNNTFIERAKGTEFIIHVSNDSWLSLIHI